MGGTGWHWMTLNGVQALFMRLKFWEKEHNLVVLFRLWLMLFPGCHFRYSVVMLGVFSTGRAGGVQFEWGWLLSKCVRRHSMQTFTTLAGQLLVPGCGGRGVIPIKEVESGRWPSYIVPVWGAARHACCMRTAVLIPRNVQRHANCQKSKFNLLNQTM